MAQAVDRENRPNMKEFMDATGVDAATASEILYGVVGANLDTRNWSQIMSSSDPVSTARQATAQMYSQDAATSETVTRSTTDPEQAGKRPQTEYIRYDNPTGKTNIIQAPDGTYAIVAGNGLAMRAGFNSLEQAQQQAANFGLGSEVDTAESLVSSQSTAQNIATPTSTGLNTNMANIEDIQNLADIMYAAQTTGVATSKLNEALQRVGINPEEDMFGDQRTALLSQYGFRPGTSDFYQGSTLQSAPVDEGLAIHYNAVQNAKNELGYLDSTQENLEQFAGKVNPATGEEYKFIVNDNVANAELIQSTLQSQGKDPSVATVASTPATTPEWQQLAQEAYTKEYNQIPNLYGGGDGDNALQWAALTRRTPVTPLRPTTSTTNQDGSLAGWGVSNFPNPPTPDPIQQAVTDAVTIPVVKPTYGQIRATPQGIVQRPESGTFSSPLQTAGLSAVPDTITVRPNYTGTTMANLTMPSQGQQSIQSVLYGNDFGQTVTVTEINGQPTTYVPPGFRRLSGQPQAQQQQQMSQSNNPLVPFPGPTGPLLSAGGGSRPTDFPTENPEWLKYVAGSAVGNLFGYNEGGSVENDAELDAMYRMATKFLGYRGPRSRKSLEDFAKSSPGAAAKMKSYTAAMAKGGMVRKGYQGGGAVTQDQLAGMSGNLVRQTLQPIQAPTSMILPQEADFIAPTAGMTVPQAPFAESATVGAVEQAQLPQFITPATFTAQQAAPQVAEETARLQAAQGQVSQQAQIQAAQQQGTAVSNVDAAQGTAILMDNPMQREIQDGELISGTAVDANKVAELNSQLQAAQATPTAQATVQGQLEGLMTQFEGGQTPAWAAGAMRNATAMLAARGLGASSLAGQAVIQATMESALPIAMADAQTRAQFEAQNLSNRQQTAMMAAQQRAAFLQLEFDQEFQSRVQNASRIADIANMNFTAEQQIALENSRIANTTNLQNLNNRQAMVMAEAASLANLDMANLNNRQQAAVQNAQNFLQMDLTNLNNEQQTGLFRAQQNIQALFTDQAAENAALQFNAVSENQTKQFFSSMNTQVSQFNTTQRNAMDQFNVNSVNAMRQFNSEVQQQRDLFNAQNGLIVAQANAQWRQNIATLNTATQNQSNMDFAKTINALTSTNLDQVWQRERDIMNYAFTQSETSMDRALSILLADKELDAYREKMAADTRDAKYALATSVILEWAK